MCLLGKIKDGIKEYRNHLETNIFVFKTRYDNAGYIVYCFLDEDGKLSEFWETSTLEESYNWFQLNE